MGRFVLLCVVAALAVPAGALAAEDVAKPAAPPIAAPPTATPAATPTPPPEAKPAPPDLTNPDYASQGLDESPSFAGNIFRMLAALGVTLALIYIVLNFGLRRLMGARAIPIGGAVVSVVQRLQVDPKHSLLVVKAAGEYLLVGSADAGMSLISKLDAETVERLQRERAQAAPAMSPFLQKLLSRRGGPPPGPQGTNP
jgi:flagellar protein FliO/FliZ